MRFVNTRLDEVQIHKLLFLTKIQQKIYQEKHIQLFPAKQNY